MFDDDSARIAFRTLTDEPAPPVTTTVDQVLRRGRRRVFAQRVGAAAGVMAVVAAIGVSAVLLRGAGGGDDLQVADTTSAPPPATRPASASLPPGFREVEMPANLTRSGEHCQDLNSSALPLEPDLELLPEEQVTKAYNTAIAEVTGETPVTVSRDWMEDSPKHEAPRGYLVNEIPIGDVPGNGQLQLEAGRFGGTPGQIADAMVAGYGNCAAPARYVAEDGTVLQLYRMDTFNPLQPMQHLQIYRPDNRFYIITSAGYSEVDVKRGADGTGSVIGGRGMLPTTQGELASIGLAMVDKLD